MTDTQTFTCTAPDENTTGEDINALIDSTRGILLGQTADDYNTAIEELRTNLNRLHDQGKLLAIPGEDTERERLRIAISEGELYYRRRATMYARDVWWIIWRYQNAIDRALSDACIGREGILSDEYAAENEIRELEKKIHDERCVHWGVDTRRPGETWEAAMEDMHRMHR